MAEFTELSCWESCLTEVELPSNPKFGSDVKADDIAYRHTHQGDMKNVFFTYIMSFLGREG